jgi:hypothetical protein
MQDHILSTVGDALRLIVPHDINPHKIGKKHLGPPSPTLVLYMKGHVKQRSGAMKDSTKDCIVKYGMACGKSCCSGIKEVLAS